MWKARSVPLVGEEHTVCPTRTLKVVSNVSASVDRTSVSKHPIIGRR